MDGLESEVFFDGDGLDFFAGSSSSVESPYGLLSLDSEASFAFTLNYTKQNPLARKTLKMYKLVHVWQCFGITYSSKSIFIKTNYICCA